jgi:S-phase kinase-associated protein 1
MQDQNMLNLEDPEEKKVESLDDSTEDEILVLVSKEDDKFKVSRKTACMAQLVKETLEDKNANEVTLANVDTKVLTLVIKYMNYHVDNPGKEIEKPLKSSNMKEVCSDWDADFVDIDQDLLFELILAANYMDIKPLLDLTCAKIASMIKGKKPEEIRKTFNIANDFTPEEELAVKAETAWCQDL